MIRRRRKTPSVYELRGEKILRKRLETDRSTPTLSDMHMNSAHIEPYQHLPFPALRAALLHLLQIHEDKHIRYNLYYRNWGHPVKKKLPKKIA